MRARVDPKLRAGIDGVAPGQEGDFPDNHASRALVKEGLLLPLEELPPEPPPRVKRAPIVGGENPADLRARFDASWEAREESHARAMGGLRSELEAAKAKASKKTPDPKPEG